MSVSVHHVLIFGTPLSPVQSLMRPVTVRASKVSVWELTENVAQESMILLRGVQASPVDGVYRFLRVCSKGISPYLKHKCGFVREHRFRFSRAQPKVVIPRLTSPSAFTVLEVQLLTVSEVPRVHGNIRIH
jgi:hypothetical protein